MRLRGPSRTLALRSRVGMGSTRPVRRSTPLRLSTDAPTSCRSNWWPSLDFRSSSELFTENPCRPAGCPAGRTTLPLLDFFRPTTQSQAGGYVSRQRIPPPPGATCEVWIPPARRLPPALPTLSRRSVHGLHPSRISLRHNRSPSRGPCPPAVTRRQRVTPKSLASRRSLLQGFVPATNPFSRRDHK